MKEHYCKIGTIEELNLADPREGLKTIGRFLPAGLNGIYFTGDFEMARDKEATIRGLQIVADPEILIRYLARTNHGVLSSELPEIGVSEIVSIDHPIPLARLVRNPFDYEFFTNVNPNRLMRDAPKELGLLGMQKVAEYGANNTVFGPALDWDGQVQEDQSNPGLVGLYCLSTILANATQNPLLYSTKRQARDNKEFFGRGQVTLPERRVTLGEFVSLYDKRQHEAELEERRKFIKDEIKYRALKELHEMQRSGEIEAIRKKAGLAQVPQSTTDDVPRTKQAPPSHKGESFTSSSLL